MEISDIVYLAFSTIVVIVVLHIGVFWVSRMIQAPQPKVVYVDRTPLQAVIPSSPLPQIQMQPEIVLPPRVEPPAKQAPTQTLNVPTYAEMPMPIVQTNKADAHLPPPIETRETDKVGWSGGK